MAVTFRCDLSAASTPLAHAWEHTVGSGHALLTLRADWQRQLRRCHQELGFRHVRFHGLLDDDMGTLICHQDKLLYSFFNADRIWDFLVSIGMRPFVELGFMPETLASGHDTVFHYHEMGAPEYLSRIQVEQLEATSQVIREPIELRYQENTVELDVDVPPHGLASVTIEFGSAPPAVGSVP